MTFTLATVSLCLTLFVGAYAGVTERIVGGTTAKISEFPFQISLRKNGRHFCSGSIISERHILTAGHCVNGILVPPYDDIIVVTGSSISSSMNYGDTHLVKSVDIHPEYVGSSAVFFPNDIAIITLQDSIKFNENQRKIDLPTAEPRIFTKAVISGWGIESYPGSLSSLVLLKANMTIIPAASCRLYLPTLKVYEQQVCALQKKGVGACSGDSGGPLSANNQVIGIASWVIPCGIGYPDVYTNVFAYKDWIKKVIAKS